MFITSPGLCGNPQRYRGIITSTNKPTTTGGRVARLAKPTAVRTPQNPSIERVKTENTVKGNRDWEVQK
jgi:hypothetical protein